MNTEEPHLDDYGKVLLQLLVDEWSDLQQALNFTVAHIRSVLLLCSIYNNSATTVLYSLYQNPSILKSGFCFYTIWAAKP